MEEGGQGWNGSGVLFPRGYVHVHTLILDAKLEERLRGTSRQDDFNAASPWTLDGVREQVFTVAVVVIMVL